MIDPPPFTGPAGPPGVGGGVGAAPRGAAAGPPAGPRPPGRPDAVVERLLVLVEARQPLLCLARIAPSLPQVGLPLVLEREVAPQLVGTLAAAPAQRLARVHQ